MTIPFTIGGLFCGAAYFGSLEMDATKPILGLEPFVFYTGCTVACMGEFASAHSPDILSDRVRCMIQAWVIC